MALVIVLVPNLYQFSTAIDNDATDITQRDSDIQIEHPIILIKNKNALQNTTKQHTNLYQYVCLV